MKYTDEEILVHNLQKNPIGVPDEHFRTNARIRILNSIDMPMLSDVPVKARLGFRVFRWIVSGITALGLAGTSVVFAAQQSEPGAGLYPLKVASEKAAIMFAPTQKTKTSIVTAVIERRAREVEHTEQIHNDVQIDNAIRSYEKTVNEATKSPGISRKEVVEQISSHEKFIEGVKLRKAKSAEAKEENEKSTSQDTQGEDQREYPNTPGVEMRLSVTPKHTDSTPTLLPTPITTLEDTNTPALPSL
jgi:hypothetical protein